MTLGDTQREFTLDIAELIQFIYSQGYEATFGDAYRDPRVFGQMSHRNEIIDSVTGETRLTHGRKSSAHKQRLAVDLNLFKDGTYLSNTEAHRPFGEFWEGLHPENVWGGRFDDGNHYSRKYKGIA